MKCYSEWPKTQMGRKSQVVTLLQSSFTAFKCEATRKPPTQTSDPDWAARSARSRMCTRPGEKKMEAFSFKTMQCGIALLISKKHILSHLHLFYLCRNRILRRENEKRWHGILAVKSGNWRGFTPAFILLEFSQHWAVTDLFQHKSPC